MYFLPKFINDSSDIWWKIYKLSNLTFSFSCLDEGIARHHQHLQNLQRDIRRLQQINVEKSHRRRRRYLLYFGKEPFRHRQSLLHCPSEAQSAICDTDEGNNPINFDRYSELPGEAILDRWVICFHSLGNCRILPISHVRIQRKRQKFRRPQVKFRQFTNGLLPKVDTVSSAYARHT